MQIRYSKTYSGLLVGIGSLLTLLNLSILGVGGGTSPNMIMGPVFLLIGAFSWGRAFIVIENGQFAVKNLLGMKFRKTAASDLFVEPLANGKRRLYRTKANGKRQRLFTGPRWMYERDDTDAFLDAVDSAGVFD